MGTNEDKKPTGEVINFRHRLGWSGGRIQHLLFLSPFFECPGGELSLPRLVSLFIWRENRAWVYVMNQPQTCVLCLELPSVFPCPGQVLHLTGPLLPS